MTLLFILSLILILGAWTLMLYGYEKRRELYIPVGICIFFIGTILLTICAIQEIPFPVHSRKTNVRTEIRQEIINGKEVSTDTVYIFTPKK